MNANVLDKTIFSGSVSTSKSTSDEETFSIPIDISDIISVCKEYSKLGWHIQKQVECIMELGVEEAINGGIVNMTSIPLIKDFLGQITNNAYFGDAASQAYECVSLIEDFELKHPGLFIQQTN
jgi:hypothetical protein